MNLTQRKTNVEESSGVSDNGGGIKGKKDETPRNEKKLLFWMKKRPTTIVLSGMILVLILSYPFLSKLLWLKCLTLSPVILCFWLVVDPSKERRMSQRLLPLALVATTFSAQLPDFLGAALAVLSILAFSLVTMPASEKSHASTENSVKPESAVPVVVAIVIMIAVLLMDNFFVWVVSATFKPGHSFKTAPDALQDNGQLVMKWLLSDLTKREVVGLRRLWNVQNGLIACLGASFVSLEVFRERRLTLYRITQRGVSVLAAARFIRVVCYSLTVLPSQSKRCYLQRFPVPPPEDWMEWILVGLRPYSHGGCNDLVISGHATVVSLLTCISASVGTDPLFQACLWSLVFLDFCVEIYEGFHYSVDMFLGTVLVCLLWRVMAPSKDPGPVPTTPRQPVRDISKSTVGVYSFIAFGAYAQVSIFPRVFTIPMILLYVGVAVSSLVKSLRSRGTLLQEAAYQHTAQHTLLCLLFLALGVYM
eukprot:scaffold1667_cov173-Amphora_coffeaeformis.AAC.7